MYITASILLILFIWGFFIEPNLLTVKRYKADNLSGKKIVFVSDFHIGKNDISRLRRIVKTINDMKPDLVLSGGDYIKGHSGRFSMPIEKIAEELKKIEAPIVSVLGNHDINFDKFSVKNELEKNGVKVLDNSFVNIDGICIAGVGGKKVEPSQIKLALENAERASILISHTPDVYYDVKDDVDLILAGHVHGGQVRVPFFGALICPSKYGVKFSCGDFKETQNRMIVTKGLGTSLLTVRFCDIPEIVVIE
jgi:predicted MPP superfamily phosphohydrolase